MWTKFAFMLFDNPQKISKLSTQNLLNSLWKMAKFAQSVVWMFPRMLHNIFYSKRHNNFPFALIDLRFFKLQQEETNKREFSFFRIQFAHKKYETNEEIRLQIKQNKKERRRKRERDACETCVDGFGGNNEAMCTMQLF